MRVKGANGLVFEVAGSVATGLIAAGIVEAIAEAEVEPEVEETAEAEVEPEVEETAEAEVEPEPEKAAAKKGRATRAK